MAAPRHVIIAGAGIAGLTAALALSRAGLRVTLLEQAAALQEAGAGIQLSPNATRVLIALGLREALEAAAMTPQAIRVMAARSGREIVRIPLGDTVERQFGAPYWTLHRADLQAALAAVVGAEQDVTLKLGARVEDFAVHGRGITVQTRHGAKVVDERGLALIGADGLWSAVRACLRKETGPRFAYRSAWRALLPAEAVPAEFREPLVQLWLGPEAHLVHYPVKGGRLINIVAIVRDKWNDTGWSAAGERSEILRHFARWTWATSARELVALPEQWQKWALFDRSAPFRNEAVPVTLIGDAAHPTLPFLAQGAGLAIEDAAVLAHMLGRYLDDPVDALRGYEGARWHRTSLAQDRARRQGRIYGMWGLEAGARNLAMRVLGGEKLLNRYHWLYSWHPPEPRQIEIPQL